MKKFEDNMNKLGIIAILIFFLAFAIYPAGIVAKNKYNVNFNIDSVVIKDNSFNAYVSFRNNSNTKVILFPPEYGLFLNVIKVNIKTWLSVFSPIMATDIDYDAYDGVALLPGETKSFILFFDRYEMYDWDEGKPSTIVSGIKYHFLLNNMSSLFLNYYSYFDSTIIAGIGENRHTETNPCFGKYTELDLKDSFEIQNTIKK